MKVVESGAGFEESAAAAIVSSVNALAPVGAGVGAAPLGAVVGVAVDVGDPGRPAAAVDDGPTVAVVIALPHAEYPTAGSRPRC